VIPGIFYVPFAMSETSKIPAWLTPSVAVLFVANLVPLYGILYLDWQVFTMMIIFWLENVVIGFYNALKMLFYRSSTGEADISKFFLIPFFIFHYGMFTAGHGIFIVHLFGGDSSTGTDGMGLFTIWRIIVDYQLGFMLVVLLVSHGFSFIWNYLGKQEYLRMTPKILMHKPYNRIILLHITILAGGFLAMLLNETLVALVVLLGLKIIFDIRAHLREHANDSNAPITLQEH
jgi:hypothetical protein